jgi:hypothetical protein
MVINYRLDGLVADMRPTVRRLRQHPGYRERYRGAVPESEVIPEVLKS